MQNQVGVSLKGVRSKVNLELVTFLEAWHNNVTTKATGNEEMKVEVVEG